MHSINSSYAYVTLVMKNDKYIAGALVLAESLRKCGSMCALVCMVTSDISVKAVKVLKKWYDYVWTVPYIRHRCVSFKTQRQRELYNDWIEESFTKWNCVNETMFGRFDKVIFIDADMMCLSNCDKELFSLSPPAMTFSLPWAKPFCDRGIENPYGLLNHGQLIEWQVVEKGFKSFIGVGSLVVIKPDQQVFNQMLKCLNNEFWFGSSQCFSGFDEQLLCLTYTKLRQSFTHIHQCYNWHVGKWNWLPSVANGSCDGDNSTALQPKMIHYYGDQKPWYSSRNGQWTDTLPWWSTADEVIAKDDATRKFFELQF